jgi:hypothetical protein
MKIRIAAALILALALILPATAGAGLPKPKTTLIVPGKSVGGVALGASAKSVEKAWGKAKVKCEFQCLYEGPKKGGGGPATASAGLEEKGKGKPAAVWIINLNAGSKLVHKELKPDFKTPLSAYKTSKGIGIGSSVGELKHAYHGLKKLPIPGTEKGVGFYELKGGGTKATTFAIAENRVQTLTVEAHRGG